MEFTVDVGVWAVLLTAVVAIIVGVALQLIGEARFSYEWIVTAAAAFLGAMAASEWVVAWRAFEPQFDGLAIVPAAAVGLIVGAVVGGATRLVETRTLRPHSY